MDWAKLSANALAMADLAPRLRLNGLGEATARFVALRLGLREPTRRRLDEQVEDFGELSRAAMAGFVGGFAPSLKGDIRGLQSSPGLSG